MEVDCGKTIHSKFLSISLAHALFVMIFYDVYVYVCFVDEKWHRAEERLVYGVESNSTLLECVPRSLQAKVIWFLQKGGEKQEVSFCAPIHVTMQKTYYTTNKGTNYMKLYNTLDKRKVVLLRFQLQTHAIFFLSLVSLVMQIVLIRLSADTFAIASVFDTP